MTFKNMLGALVVALVSFGLVGAAHATGTRGTVYCDVDQSGDVNVGDLTLESVEVVVDSTTAGPFTDLTNVDGIYFIDLPNDVPHSYDQSLNPATLPANSVIVGPAVQSFTLTETELGARIDWLVDAPVCRGAFCGDGYIDEGEICDDGNNIDGDGCSAVCTDEVSEGCTPGYWKQSQHFDSYPAGVTPDTAFSDLFEDAFPGKTLVEVMSTGGGGLNALGRHVVAAYLNSSTIGYNLSQDSVVDAFNAVYPGSKNDYNTQKDVFEMFNESGCPLN